MVNKIILILDPHTRLIYARRYEQSGEWEKAKEMFIKLGSCAFRKDIASIDMILEATKKGDEFRKKTSLVKGYYESGLLTIGEYSLVLDNVYKQVYN